MLCVVFLDIDGVLNSNFWNDCHQREISDGTRIDAEKIGLLAQLVRRTGAELVLHSGWRIWFDSELHPLRAEAGRFMQMLAQEGLHLSGITPDLTTEEIRKTKKFSLVKADEILLWLKLHPKVGRWAVLDDLDLHNPQVARHQMKPDPSIGLTAKDIAAAEQLLLGETGR